MSDSQFTGDYRQEAEERLSEVEEAILDVEENPDDPEAIDRLFRAIHTIKGSGAMFGFEQVAVFTHHVENVLDKVREGELPITEKLIEIVLASRDHIKAMLETPENEAGYETEGQRLIKALTNLAGNEAPPMSLESSAWIEKSKATEEHLKLGQESTYRIRFRPSPQIFRSGLDPGLLIKELQELGECHVTAQTEEIPNLSEIDPEACYLFWDIVLTSACGLNAVKDVFIFVEDDSDVSIRPVADGVAVYDDPPSLGEILVNRGDVTAQSIQNALSQQKKLGELLVDSGEVPPDRIKSALDLQKALQQRTKVARATTVRVGAEKLDVLINLVGELVINQDRILQVTSDVDVMALANPVEELGRLTKELRDCALNLRMLPIGNTFRKFKRLVRDLSTELGKDIELVIEGSDTELDKTVIERLEDPLVHLIRNCVDHGIESPAQRVSAGKPAKGKIHLEASHREGNVVITIDDDGRGLDRDAIMARAIEKGMVNKNAQLAETELFDMIFVPGFSTTEQVSNVSGRGVGMDVVKREIELLRGSIKISSDKKVGTTISLFLPLTLAIIESFLVDVRGRRFVLPVTMVDECVELNETLVAQTHGQHLIPVRGDLIPYVRLHEFFGIGGHSLPIEQIVILKAENARLGVVVDQIIGVHQAVIRSLGTLYQYVEGLSGATIMGDGTVALIVDVPGLMRTAKQDQSAAWATKDTPTAPVGAAT